MIRIARTIRLPRPPREVLLFVADLRNLPQWDTTASAVEKTTEGRMESGARFTMRLRAGDLRDLPLQSQLIRLSPPHAATLRSTGPGLTLIDEFRVEADGADGTVLQWQREAHIESAWRARMLAPLLRRSAQRATRRLGQHLRREGRPRLGPLASLADRLLLPGAARFTQPGYRLAGLPAITTRGEDVHIAISGATGGIGEAAAIGLARAGAQLTVIGRDTTRLQALQRRLRIDSGSTARIVEADLLDLDATARAAVALASGPPVNVLINNAGALFDRRAVTNDGIERALCVNLLSPWLLMRRLLPVMPPGSRVVNVVSGGMYLTPLDVADLNFETGRYDGAIAYARAKRALTLLSARQARAWPEHAVHCMHPGWVDTPGVRTSLPRFHRLMRALLRDAEAGADTIIWLALSPLAARSQHGVWFDRAPHAIDVLRSTRCPDDVIDTLDGEIRALVGPRLADHMDGRPHSG